MTTPSSPVPPERPVALQCIDRFVGRTMNWFYDHMRFVPRHRPVIICTALENRDEFPEMEALLLTGKRLGVRVWNKLSATALYPFDTALLRAKKPTVFHSHLGYVATRDARYVHSLELPWVVSFYGADVYLHMREPHWVEAYQPVFEKASRVLSLGPAMNAGLAAMGCDPRKIVIHPLGVDAASMPHRARERRPDEPLRILFAGTFREKKGTEYLLRAAHTLRRRGVPITLTLVGDAAGRPGDPEYKAKLFDLIGQFELDEILTHHKWLKFDDLVKLGLSSHVFVVPSVTAGDGDAEGTPAVMGQMMATAMPTIATRHSDIPYTFGPYADRLIPERDPDALADRLQRYYDEPEVMTREGLAYREQILSTFDTRICAAALSGIYETL